MFGIVDGISNFFSNDEYKELPPKKRAKVQQEALDQIDLFLEEQGIDGPEIGEDDFRYFTRESANGWAGVTESEGVLFFVVHGILMETLPSDRDLLMPLMRDLLLRNMELPGEARFGILNEMVVLGLSVPLPDAWSFSIDQHIEEVMALADELQGEFLEKYQGTSRARLKP